MKPRALPIVSGDDSREVVVSGGSRGLTVEYRELQAAGRNLEETLERLNDLRFRGIDICFRLRGLSALPETASRAAVEVETVVQGMLRNMADLEGAAENLGKAGENYLDAEGRVEDQISKSFAVALALTLWHRSGWGYPSRTVSELLVPDTDGAAAQKVWHKLILAGAVGPVAVRKQDGDHGDVRLSGTAGDLLERSRLLLEEDWGVIEVLSVIRGGQRVWIVTLPGTQNGPGPGGPNPFDNFGNVEAGAGDSLYLTDAVRQALRQAGAAPGDSIILGGYSQGGMHAINIGARLAQDGEFNIEMVVTAAAPRGNRDLPEGVKGLHLEHAQDWVAGSDGASNPDTPDRVTVTGAAPVPDGEGSGLGPAHQLDVHLEVAAQADASSDPSLRESLGHLAEVIGPGAVATRSLFQFSRTTGQTPTRSPGRTPSPSPQAPPRPPPKRPFGPGSGLPPSNPAPSRGGTAPLPGPGGNRLPPVLTNPVAPLGRWLPAGPGQ